MIVQVIFSDPKIHQTDTSQKQISAIIYNPYSEFLCKHNYEKTTITNLVKIMKIHYKIKNQIKTL